MALRWQFPPSHSSDLVRRVTELPMSKLAPDQQAMLATWQQHTYAEFELKDADAALATMTEDPYVLAIPCGTSGSGRAGVHEFYANHFLPNIPPDFELTSLSQTHRSDRRRVRHSVYAHARDGLDAPGPPGYGQKARVRPGGHHSVSSRQNSQRASLLGPSHGALPVGCPGSSVGGGRGGKCGTTFEASVTPHGWCESNGRETTSARRGFEVRLGTPMQPIEWCNACIARRSGYRRRQELAVIG